MRTAKALARLRACAGSPEPSLITQVISTMISCSGSNNLKIDPLEIQHPKFENSTLDLIESVHETKAIAVMFIKYNNVTYFVTAWKLRLLFARI